MFAGVHKLSPGHTLLMRVGDRNVAPQRMYWDVVFAPDASISEDRALDELRARLTESVRLRLMSEVPLGAFLSGGVDSSAVVATMAQLSSDPVNTCSIAFDDPAYNEAEFAQEVATRYRTRHRGETVAVDDFGLIDRLAGIYDEPYADSSAIPTYRVCELARRNVTVALSGDGGDESFGGYRRYQFQVAEERMRALLPGGLRRPLFAGLGAAYPKLDWAPRMFRAKSTLQALARDAVDGYFHTMSILRDEQRSELYTDAFRRRLNGYRASDTFHRHARNVRRASTRSRSCSISTSRPTSSETSTPRSIARHGELARSSRAADGSPARRVARDAAAAISSCATGVGKYLLKKAMEPMLPRSVLYRRKMGFAVPLAAWFRGPLRSRVREAVLGPRLAETGWFNAATLERMVDSHQAGSRDHSSALWSLLMLEAFLRNTVEAAAQPSGLEVAA